MDVSAEAADVVVRESLQAAEEAVEPDSPTKKKLDQLQRLAAQSRPEPKKQTKR